MSSAPPPPPPILNTSLALHRTLLDFLTVSIHTLLYTRSLYPPDTFITARAYNFPVRQNRHPSVCNWVNSTISSISPLLQNNNVARVIFVVYSEHLEVMERYLFDISRFPIVDPKEKMTEFEDTSRGLPNIVDIEEQLRATIRRLDYTSSKLSPLPENCTYTVAVELRDEALPPIGHPQPWVPSDPNLQVGKGGEKLGEDVGGVRTTPVRLVDAGDFVVEMWVEEGRAKVDECG